MFEDMDFSKMGAMLEEMQKKAREFEEQSQNKEFVVKSGGSMVAIKISGKGEVLDVSIDDSLLQDKDSLSILLISAMNDAIKLVENEKKNIASQMLGGLGGLNL